MGEHIDKSRIIGFVAKYSAMLEAQINDVRSNMESTVSELMTSINTVYDSAERIKEAERILVRAEPADGTSESFVSQDVDGDSSSQPSKMPEGLDAKAIEAGKKLKTKMEEIQQVNERLTNEMMGLMGLLSEDDVVRQQLEHVVFSMSCLKNGLEKLLLESNGKFSSKAVAELAEKVKRETFNSYTSQEEKEIFRSVFGGDGLTQVRKKSA